MPAPAGHAPLLVPGAEPFLLAGGPTGCVLVHGHTAMPAEMHLLADELAAAGHSVLGVRLAGHGTEPRDLLRVRWRDWLATVADGIAVLGSLAEKIVLVGQSLGGAVALTAAARLPVAGVIAISTPFELPRPLLPRWPWRVSPKGVPAHPELGLRREADYPAYAAAPERSGREARLLVARMRAGLGSLTVPVLVVSSEADPWVPASHGRALAAAIPASQLVILTEAGHSIVLDPVRAEAFDAIKVFVRAVA